MRRLRKQAGQQNIYRTCSNGFKYIKYIYIMVPTRLGMRDYQNLVEDKEYAEMCKGHRDILTEDNLEQILGSVTV